MEHFNEKLENRLRPMINGKQLLLGFAPLLMGLENL